MVFFGMRTKTSASEKARAVVLSSIQNQMLRKLAQAQHLRHPFTIETIDAYGRSGARVAMALVRAGLARFEGGEIRVTRAGAAKVGPLGPRRQHGPLATSILFAALKRSKPRSPAQKKIADRREEKAKLDAWFRWANSPLAEPVGAPADAPVAEPVAPSVPAEVPVAEPAPPCASVPPGSGDDVAGRSSAATPGAAVAAERSAGDVVGAPAGPDPRAAGW